MNSGDLDGPIPKTLCKFCSWRCPLARNAPEQHSGAQKYLSMVMWVPQGCPSASFLGFFRAILACDGAAKKQKKKIKKNNKKRKKKKQNKNTKKKNKEKKEEKKNEQKRKREREKRRGRRRGRGRRRRGILRQ